MIDEIIVKQCCDMYGMMWRGMVRYSVVHELHKDWYHMPLVVLYL